MFVLALIDGLCAFTLRLSWRRAMAALALFTAILHGAIWPLLAVAADGSQLIEICTSDGVKRVLVDAGGVSGDAPISAEHSECATCVCTSGGCAGMACVAASEVVFYYSGPVAFSTAALTGHRTAPYAFSPSRDPPAV